MRSLLCLLVPLLALVACSDARTEAPLPPESVRKCGELDGVESVEPEILGEDGLGCPVFAPVPCTKPIAEYESVCGTECAPWSATKTDGDSWLLGCAWTFPICGGPDYKALECGIDPFRGEEYWFWENECDPIPLYYYDCWMTCDAEREPTDINCL